MGFAQWFWRLFLVFTALITAHALLVAWLATTAARGGAAADFPTRQIWLVSGAAIAAGALATWFCIRRIIAPLAQLARQVRTVDKSSPAAPSLFAEQDEIGLLAGAFSQLQHDLAHRLLQIQANNERLETVLSSMAEGVMAVSPDNAILLANDAGRRLLDFASPDPIGRSLLQVTRARPVYDAVSEAFSSAAPVVTEFDAPGAVRRRLSLRATRLPGNPCPGVMIVLHDMTDLRRLESLRRELVANVSHELKTPLAAIKGYAETLRLGAVNDTEHNLQFVHRIEEQADRLHELILDILQLARLESGQETLEIGDVSVRGVIEDCVTQFAEVAAARNIELSAELPSGEATVRADDEGLRTLLNNLLDNAIKYTPAGGRVAVQAIVNAATVVLQVADTGIGIPQTEQARIFERFYRVDRARSRELGGTGLGLSIVKHLAQAFGGTATVESQPGRGATFRVELPRGAQPNPPPHN